MTITDAITGKKVGTYIDGELSSSNEELLELGDFVHANGGVLVMVGKPGHKIGRDGIELVKIGGPHFEEALVELLEREGFEVI